MGARTADDILKRVTKREENLVAPAPEPPPPPAPPTKTPALARKEQMNRRGLIYTGFYISHQAKEQMRDLHYRTRKEKQDLMREAMNLLFERYDMDPVNYPSKDEQSDNL